MNHASTGGIMGLGKTDKGRRVLAERSAALNPRERQALVLCDGRRRPEELHHLLGAEGPALLRRLLDDGFIVRSQDASRTAPPDVARRPAGPDRLASPPPQGHATALPHPVATEAARPAATPAPAMPQEPASRTSLAGAKMYLIDMLQLLRDADASAHAVALHMAQDETALVSAMAQAMGFIRQASPLTYAARVHERLAALLPEPHRAALGPTPATDTAA